MEGFNKITLNAQTQRAAFEMYLNSKLTGINAVTVTTITQKTGNEMEVIFKPKEQKDNG